MLGDENADPLIKFSEIEQEENLRKNIQEQLSENEKQVFNLLLKGLNYKEIATLLDKNEKQIDNTIQRIRGKVRQLLKEE